MCVIVVFRGEQQVVKQRLPTRLLPAPRTGDTLEYSLTSITICKIKKSYSENEKFQDGVIIIIF